MSKPQSENYVDIKSIEEWIQYLASTPVDQIKPVSDETYNKIRNDIQNQCISKTKDETSK